MIWVESTCILYGPSYSPKLAETLTGLSFVEKNEPGEIGVFGRFKGEAIPYGSSTLVPPRQLTEANPDFGIEWLTKVTSKYASHFQEACVVDITIRVNVFHDGQCNLEFSHSLLKTIATSSAGLTISCYEDSDYLQKKMVEASHNK